jgi:hypothetical protein
VTLGCRRCLTTNFVYANMGGTGHIQPAVLTRPSLLVVDEIATYQSIAAVPSCSSNEGFEEWVKSWVMK